ncbi:MAG: hypothetical protein JWM58_3801 [Rhizobium sp.]|nr:hypothetical protein [Rhizobium sp.]
MAIVKYTDRMGPYGDLGDFYNPQSLMVNEAESTEKKIIYDDVESTNRIVLTGNNLGYTNNVVDEGTITGIKFTNHDNQNYVVLTGGNYSAQAFSAAFEADGIHGMLELALKGDDKMVGSLTADVLYSGSGNDNVKGGSDDDYIYGGKGDDKLFGDAGADYLFGDIGNDTMEGGAQSDIFHFRKGTGKDTITDFDADGNNQDFLNLVKGENFTVKQVNNDDLRLDFGNGDTLLLLDVDKGDFSKADYHYAMV